LPVSSFQFPVASGTHWELETGRWSLKTDSERFRMNTSGSMTKAELVEEVSRVSDLTKKHSEVIVDTVFKSIIDALHRGEKIELRGFGSFRLRRREPRKGRNPKTGDKVDVPPKKVPYFKPGKELKELINREADAPQAPPALSGSDLAGV